MRKFMEGVKVQGRQRKISYFSKFKIF